MKREKIARYDTADYLKTDEDIAAYLEATIEDGDPQTFAIALGNILRAGNVSQMARETGVTREGLYKAFSGEGNPSFATVSKVSRALGLRILVVPASAHMVSESTAPALARTRAAERKKKSSKAARKGSQPAAGRRR